MAVRQTVDIVRPNHNTNSPEANDPAKSLLMGILPPLPPDDDGSAPADVPPGPVADEIPDIPPEIPQNFHHVPGQDGAVFAGARWRTRVGVFTTTASMFLLTTGFEYFAGST